MVADILLVAVVRWRKHTVSRNVVMLFVTASLTNRLSEINLEQRHNPRTFLDPDWEGGSQKATLAVFLLVVVISSPKIPKAFLIRSAAQRNFANTFALTFLTDLSRHIFKLISN